MSEDSVEIPQSLRALRACLTCKLIKQQKHWQSGCQNCGWESGVHENTTPVFKGVLAMMQPEGSWVARWQKQERRVKGLYAMQVVGADTQDD